MLSDDEVRAIIIAERLLQIGEVLTPDASRAVLQGAAEDMDRLRSILLPNDAFDELMPVLVEVARDLQHLAERPHGRLTEVDLARPVYRIGRLVFWVFKNARRTVPS